MRLFRRQRYLDSGGHPEDKAIRIACRSLARNALALEDMLAEDRLWGREREQAFRRLLTEAQALADAQWPQGGETHG